MLAMPRLPTPIAMRAPGANRAAKPAASSVRRASARTSLSRRSGKFWRISSSRVGSIAIADGASGVYIPITRRSMRFRQRVMLFVGVCLLAAGRLGAQTVGGSLQGLVVDPTGAAVPGARVTIVHVDTATSRELTADDGGRYHAPILPPG